MAFLPELPSIKLVIHKLTEIKHSYIAIATYVHLAQLSILQVVRDPLHQP